MRLPRQLDPVEVRVLGALLEKEQTTPEYYPLTVNALVSACNQVSNRDPIMDLDADDVSGALDRLHEDVLVWPTQSARSQRWRHSLERRWELDRQTRAVMTVLLLRGAQTAGELRARSERLYPFRSTTEVEATLERLALGPEPLVARIERRPGQKESRWTHLAGGAPDEGPATDEPPSPPLSSDLEARLEALESRVEALERELALLDGKHRGDSHETERR